MRTPLALLVAFACLPGVRAAAPDYQRDIQTIFNTHCVSCHGPDKARSGLRLDSLTGLRKGSNSGDIISAGKSADSILLKALTGSDGYAIMPPKAPRPTEAEIAKVKAWIDGGAKGEDNTPIVETKQPRSTHWAFQPIRRAALPTVQQRDWVQQPLDAFVLAKLEASKIKPSPEADRVTLLRRLSLDLIGLPPTPAEVEAFVNDHSPNAYERQVDRLLASPHYGERWGRHWLDAARYADTNGYSIDAPRSIWKYRDWVIQAINDDMPFDRFTTEQLAGDLLPNPTTDQLVATGFHRNTQINQEGGIDVEQFRIESVVDRVNTTGTVWLGLTVGCAQCHDHKYDPLSQREYYELFAFFNNVDEPNQEIITPELERRRRAVRAQLAGVEAQLKLLDTTNATTIEKWERSLNDDSRETLFKPVRAVFEVAPNGRSPKQIAVLENAHRLNDQTRHLVGGLAQSPFIGLAHVHLLKTRQRLIAERDRLKTAEPVAVTTMIVRERKVPRKTNVHLGGDFLRKGIEVRPATPGILPPLAQKQPTRLDLARWLTDPNNPLTARVIVNRYWDKFFGIGLVETDNDFGTQGTAPSHPEMLDWLASEFVRLKWSSKALHKTIVMSATYRQSSKVRPELVNIDARNRLLARQNRFRLDAEIVRDVSLAASGLLSPAIGGPSVRPPQPDGVYNFTQIKREWKADSGADRYRRAMYTYFQRSAAHPGLITFDAPDATVTCTRRVRSNTPLQALTMLNDEGFVEFAHAFADRIVGDKALTSDGQRLEQMFRLAVSRGPNPREAEILGGYLRQWQSQMNAGEAWVMLARVVLNLDEFITRE